MVGLIREVFGSKALIWVGDGGGGELLKVVKRMYTMTRWRGGAIDVITGET